MTTLLSPLDARPESSLQTPLTTPPAPITVTARATSAFAPTPVRTSARRAAPRRVSTGHGVTTDRAARGTGRNSHAGVAPRNRPAQAAVTARPVGTRCAGGVGELTAARRRRATLLAVLAGVGLALTVWVVGVVGADYQRATTPTATSTQVVHVRAGDSLSSIAQRVAPDVARQTVIDEIVDLNDLPSSGLRVGQPLLTPTYR